MHRMKIGLAAAGILLVVTLGVYFVVTSSLKKSAVAEVERGLDRAGRAFAELGRLRGSDGAMEALASAKRPTIVNLFAEPDPQKRIGATSAECDSLNADFTKAGHQATIIAVLDAAGKVVARNLNPRAMQGEDLKARFPAVAQALGGRAVSDVWSLESRSDLVALAPIARTDGTVLGALLIGYALSGKGAQDTRDAVGAEVGYFHEGKMQVSSFGSAGDPDTQDATKTQALGALAFGPERLAEQALQKRVATASVHTTIDGREYVALAVPLLGSAADRTAGVILASSVSDALDRVDGVGPWLFALGLLAIAVAALASGLTSRRFIRPLDKIEVGVGEIINGNIDYTFTPVGPDFEGLSNALNVMLARLLGREEPNEDAVEEEDDEAAASRKWRAEQMLIDEGDGAAVPGADSLAQEGEAAYYPRLFNEYASALRSMGKPSEGVSVPAFMAKLRLAEAGLKEKWSCKMVRFQLVARGSDLVFRAIRID